MPVFRVGFFNGLPELTDSDLIQLGVVSVSWQLLFRMAITRHDGQDTQDLHQDPAQQNKDQQDYHQDNTQQNDQASTENNPEQPNNLEQPNNREQPNVEETPNKEVNFHITTKKTGKVTDR